MSMVVSPYVKSCSVDSSFLFFSSLSILYSLFPSAYTSTALSRAFVARSSSPLIWFTSSLAKLPFSKRIMTDMFKLLYFNN